MSFFVSLLIPNPKIFYDRTLNQPIIGSFSGVFHLSILHKSGTLRG